MDISLIDLPAIPFYDTEKLPYEFPGDYRYLAGQREDSNWRIVKHPRWNHFFSVAIRPDCKTTSYGDENYITLAKLNNFI